MPGIDIFLICVIIVLISIAIVQRSKVVIAKRNSHILKKNISKEREATADILKLSKEVINTGSDSREFLPNFIEYALRTLKGTGGAVLECDESGNLIGCAIAGTFPPLREVSVQVEQQLMAHAKKHTESFKGYKAKFSSSDIEDLCADKGYAFFERQCPIWFPERFIKEAPRILISPIKVKRKTLGCVIITSGDDFDAHRLMEEDGKYLVRLVEIASLSLEVLKVFKERQEYEVNIRAAREEGMMQVSTGIIHNIGNAVTVAKLSVQELQDKANIKKEERPETLIIEEILPQLKKHLESGDIADFLKNDQIGSQYFEIITELLSHTNDLAEESSVKLKSLATKLNHISEIIELQQRFVGELGTENMTHLSTVIDSSIKIFEETFNKRGVEIKTEIDSKTPEVLIDSSMMTQVIMNLVKNAVEAMDSENASDKNYFLNIKLTSNELIGTPAAIVEVSDNGPGMPEEVRAKIFDFGFSTKGVGSSRGYGLHSCMETVKKYDGTLEVESEEGKGTTFRISIPVAASENII
jgi:signal transduction histidine kinase